MVTLYGITAFVFLLIAFVSFGTVVVLVSIAVISVIKMTGKHLIYKWRKREYRFWYELLSEVEVQLHITSNPFVLSWQRIGKICGTAILTPVFIFATSICFLIIGVLAVGMFAKANNTATLAVSIREEIELYDDEFEAIQLPMEMVQYVIDQTELYAGQSVSLIRVDGPEVKLERPTAFFSYYGDYSVLVDWSQTRPKRPWEEKYPVQLQIFVWDKEDLIPSDVVPHFGNIAGDWISYPFSSTNII